MAGENDASKFTLDRLFRFLTPELEIDESSTKPEAISKKIEKLLIESKGKAYRWDDIVEVINGYFTGASNEQIADARDKFRFLGPYSGKRLDGNFFDTRYFKNSLSNTPIYGTPRDIGAVSVFAIRDPMVSPGVAGCDKIGRFLNYTPSFVASQMVPFLEVELRIEGGSDYTRTPGVLRFLLGSKDSKGSLSAPDRILYEGDRIGENGQAVKNSTDVSYTRVGMEAFLMPQSLTNMETLTTGQVASSRSRTRLSPVKPFLPLASIEGFDVTLRNAGAKNFVHKTANLKLKIHDKARISEMEEFIRGGDGFRRVTIVTRYGWHAPRSAARGENEFFDFINREMNIEDFWSIVNSQFSFDSMGQVNVGLQLISAAMRYNSTSNVVQGSEADDVKTFSEQVNFINKQLDILRERNAFPANVTVSQTLNDAAYKGVYTNKDGAKVIKAINDFEQSLIKWRDKDPKLVEGIDIKLLISALKSLAKQKDPKTGKSTDSLFEKGQKGARREVDDLLDAVGIGADPWLPKQNAGFNPALVAEVDRRLAEDRKSRKKAASVVSFAKLMLMFTKGLVQSGGEIDEVQLMFYQINDFAGYAGASDKYRAISLAEFPIDMNALKASYYARVKELNTTVLNLDEFFKLVIDQNFTDSRGIGFGKSSYYAPIDLTKPAEAPKVKDAGQLKIWEDANPRFQIPIIDMVLKVEETDPDPQGKRTRIKKISVFDRTNVLYEDITGKTIDEQKAYLESGVPLITIGTNGSLIMNSTVASKTDGSQQAVYIARSLQTDPLKGKIDPRESPTEDANNQLPIRTLPVQLTMTSLGCPLAALYQQYFVDFFTRTTLDNLYMCTQVQHSLTPGKYNTSWTFMQSNGYARFVRPTVPAPIATQAEPKKAEAEKQKQNKGKKATTVPKEPMRIDTLDSVIGRNQ